MGFLSRIREHFTRRVINDNSGIIESLPALFASINASKKLGPAAKIGLTGAGSFGLGKLFGLGKGGDDVSFEDQRTPDQIAAAEQLQSLGMTGSGAGINLGEAYGGSLGNFETTGLEKQGLSQLFNQQPNQALTQAQDVFGQFSQASFDPSTLEPFRKAAVRSEGQALDRLSQAKAATGSRFGTGFGRDASSLIEGTELGIQQQLANLFQNQQQVGLQGAQGLAGVGGQQANLQQNQLQNLFNYGGTERDLANQKAQAEFTEFNRQRGETLDRIGLLQGEANRNPLLGVSSIPGSPSPFSQLIGSVLKSGGEAVGEQLGNKVGDLFKSKKTTSDVRSNPSTSGSLFKNPKLKLPEDNLF